MGKKIESTVIPYNDYVLDLGAHEPPAPPEKELAEMRGSMQVLLATAIAIFLVIDVIPMLWRAYTESNSSKAEETEIVTIASEPTETALEETSIPTEEQKGIGFIAFLDRGNGRLENLIEGEVYHVFPGDMIEVWGYSDYAEIELIVYYIPEINPVNTALPSIQLEKGRGFIPLPDYPAGEYFHLYVMVQDVDGNYCEFQQYILAYESDE